MEALKRPLMMILVVPFMVACTKTQFVADAVATTPTEAAAVATVTATPTATVTPTTIPTCTATSTVDLSIVSVSTLSDYASKYLYAPTTVKVSVNLVDVSQGRYAGSIQVSYYDQGAYHSGVFSAPSGTNVSISSLKDNGTYMSEYNRWYNGNLNFSGFFQDTYGAIVLTVSGVDANGCASGSVYYRNFTSTAAVQSPYRKCWFIRSGPYECRSSAIIDKTSLTPGDGYTLLGTFSGLSSTAAFR